MDNRRITRGLATNMARNAVLDTTELLEAIILCLPAINIFGVRRVSTEWLDTILSSKRVQQKTFLSPITSDERWRLRGVPRPSSSEQEYDDVELAVFPRDVTSANKDAVSAKQFFGREFVPVDLCPLLSPYWGPFDIVMKLLRLKRNENCTFDMLDLVGRSGPWRGMYVTNLPCKVVRLRASLELKEPPHIFIKSAITLRDEGGLKLGALLDRLLGDVGEYIFSDDLDEGICDDHHFCIEDHVGSTRLRFESISLSQALAKHGIYRCTRSRFLFFQASVTLNGVVVATETEKEAVRTHGLKAKE